MTNITIQELKEKEIRLFDSAEQYEAVTGNSCPVFDHTIEIKMWDDPTPPKSAGRPKRVYPRALMLGPDTVPVVEDGAPIITQLVIDEARVGVVNIPREEDVIRHQNSPEHRFKGRIPWPIRALTADEYWAKPEFGAPGQLVVRLRSEQDALISSDPQKVMAQQLSEMKTVLDAIWKAVKK